MSEETKTPALILYTVPNCPLCVAARDWLARHRVAYVERDVAHDFGALRAMYKLTRQKLVPVFAPAGQHALVRPTEDELQLLVLRRD